MGKLISDESIGLFPISTINDLVTFIENEFLQKEEESGEKEPNLALLSIVLGRVEQSLTVIPTHSNGSYLKKARSNKTIKALVTSNLDTNANGNDPEAKGEETAMTGDDRVHDFPPLDYDLVVGLYENFKAIVFSGLNHELILRDKNSPTGTSRELIKSISDLFWNTLSRNYLSDKPHLQTLYAYVTGYKLDSFGLAFAVVAGSQILGLRDVHLVLSEDHAWVTFGKGDQVNSTAEVTWHGKAGEDKRGRPIEENLSWLYLKGSPIVCNRWTEMAAIVSAINPSMNVTSDSQEMAILQKQLLWKLHYLNLLKRYPMAVAHLADLEETSSPTTDTAKTCIDLFEEAISINRQHYNNMHVYPYLYYGGYLYRHEDYKGALKYWSEAAQVVSNYRYSKVDEEIYKEFLEISKELLTSMMKKCSAGFSAKSPTRDPACYAYLLRYFDGICLWEELGTTPVLHITWAQCWLHSLMKFEWIAREGVKLFDGEEPKPGDEQALICDNSPPIGQTASGLTDLNGNSKGPGGEEDIIEEDGNRFVTVYFRSLKMKSVRTLLQKEKFNQGTLTLQITAQPTLLVAESHETGAYSFGGRSRAIKHKTSENCEAQPPHGSDIATRKRKRYSSAML